MGAVKPQTTRGPQTGILDYRARLGVLEYGGMIPDGDAGSLPDNRLRLVINGRYRNGSVESRKGQNLLTPAPLLSGTAVIAAMIDFQMSTRRSLYIVGDGCPGISASVGAFIGFKDFDMSPEYQPGVYYSSTLTNCCVGQFGDALYIGQDGTFRRFQLIDASYGSPALNVSGNAQDLPIFTFTGFVVNSIDSFDGKCFIALDGGGASAVYTFDGVTVNLDLSAIPKPARYNGFERWRDFIVMGHEATGTIRYRTAGGSPGTWTAVASAMAGWRDAVSYKNDLYIVTGLDGNVWKYDGTTLSNIHTLVGGTPIAMGCEIFNGFLYVAWGTGAANGARLARFDGTTWVDVHKDFGAQFTSPAPQLAGPIRAYRGNLEVGISQGADRGAVYTSPGVTTNGTWTKLGGGAGSLNQLLVF